MIEAYDKDVMGSSQIRRTGEGGRVGKDRRKLIVTGKQSPTI